MTSVTTDHIRKVKGTVREGVRVFGRRKPGFEYADVRLEIEESRWGMSECGEPRMAEQDVEISLGVRVLARGSAAPDSPVAPGYYGMRLGPGDVGRISRVLKPALSHAYERARAGAKAKEASKASFGPLGDSLWSCELAKAPVAEAVIPARFKHDPRKVPLKEVLETARDAAAGAMAKGKAVKYAYSAAMIALRRQLFVNSAGSCVDQSWALAEGDAYVVAEKDGVTQESYDTLGSNVGWELLSDGMKTDYERFPRFKDFMGVLADDVVQLCSAPRLPVSEKPVVVVTDPHYNTLLVHEIVGHPVELDRALKMETAYAGRTWLFGSAKDNLLGRRIASEKLSAYSDPSLPGYGYYAYDDEGVPGGKVMHVENGIFRGFMNSLQTSAMLRGAGLVSTPNGHYKATSAPMVPLIRMSTTVFAPGQDDPKSILGDVEHGYYLVGHKIPSISESRENFRISARKVYEIRNGKIGQLYRDGGMFSDSREFFMNVDAVGNDFRIYPVPNCGKGQPMQTKRLGNGGPTLRSRARLI
ncbi:MAG: TldD/PmbA family protein [Nitrospirae bacterium]|nr:TldD/PmbA family protein [Nitrospirota bacterium]